MKFKDRTLSALADMIVGNTDTGKEVLFPYRSSSYITKFFQECDTDYKHDGTTRNPWADGTLIAILEEPQASPNVPPDTFARLIRTLMDQADKTDADPDRKKALALLNLALNRKGSEAFYAEDSQCYLRHVATNTIAQPAPSPHRPF